MSDDKIGFAGVGNMGSRMVRRLLDAGHEVVIHDPKSPAVADLVAHGAVKAGSLSDLGSQASVVLLSLPTPDVVHEAVLGEGGISDGGRVEVIVDMSTTGPAAARDLAAGLGDKNLACVDAPVSGGVAGAEKGTLAIMVACAGDAFERVEPLLSHLGRPVHVGEAPGMAQTMKVINNLISVTTLAISSEALALGVKAGLEPNAMLEVINAGSGRNGATLDKIPKHVLTRNFDFGFALSLSRKDTSLCLAAGEELGVPMVIGNTVRQLLTITQARYGDDADMTMIARCLEDWAGVEIK